MKIAIVGTGYVGLVTGTCFADSGNEVTCIDNNEGKIEQLSQGKIPIYEPALEEMVLRNAAAGRLHFTTRIEEGVPAAKLVFLTVGTPETENGSADLNALWDVVDQIAPFLAADALVVIKSTVPIGTNGKVSERLKTMTGRICGVISNPEFLKEGAAVNDFMFPDRVVIGAREEADVQLLRQLYAPFLRTGNPVLVMSPESAEMTNYAANALLSTKISFINEIASFCERAGADIDDVRRGIGHDQRIGLAFLFPGVGYGGSCVPRDVRSLSLLAQELGVESRLMNAVDAVNNHQKMILVDKILAHFDHDLNGKTIAVWGLAFKPRTDDIREAPSLALIDRLLEAGARLCVHDPEATSNVREIYDGRLIYGSCPLDVLVGADGLAINTEWREYRSPDFPEMRKRMNAPVVFDGRNLYEPTQMKEAGFTYYCIGRPAV